jgi:hypothetical protein
MSDADAVNIVAEMESSVGHYGCGREGCQVVIEIPEGDFSNCATFFEVIEKLWRMKEYQRRKAREQKGKQVRP